ncbi:MAG: hydroxymethylbilane synthase [Gemmatimonadota bacterium]
MVGGEEPALTSAERPFRLASRGSSLALWQAEHVAGLLRNSHAGLIVQIHVVKTTGDRVTDLPLAMIGDRGLFTREVDTAVLDGRADGAVHSLKDLPTRLEEGLALGAILPREDPSDALVTAPSVPGNLADLPSGARVATSSLRRRALLLAARPDLATPDIRGNVDTRLAKVASGEVDAVVLAAAGLRRLGRADRIDELLDVPAWLPAVGQGALAVSCRERDEPTRALLAPLTHDPTERATAAERSLLRRLEGGCQIPIGALATVVSGRLALHGLIASLDGRRLVRGEGEGLPGDAEALGEELAERLLRDGGGAILADLRAHAARDAATEWTRA